MKSARDVIDTDLNYIYQNALSEFKSISGRNLLITGGAGFLGYYLVQSVLFWNSKVDSSQCIKLTVMDNFMRGVPEWLMDLKKDKKLHLSKHDITKPLPDHMEDFQYIIHAASIASPTYYRKYPIETMDANVNGLRFLLDYSRARQNTERPVRGFLFFSSSEIYGNPSTDFIPTPEHYPGSVSCTGPRACYDESKRYGETLCVNFARQYHLPLIIARPFNNYGPGLKITDKRVIPDFVKDILAGKNIRMFSDGTPTRTFCYVADAIIGYYKILIGGQKGEAYNIGVAEPEISMADLARKIVEISTDIFEYRGKVELQHSMEADYLTDNPMRRCPDISKARKELGYNPGISLEEGLLRSLLWYSEYREGEDA
jgi:dTDP-glucose 4,6-dehydratase/UDP-glucuronate decarboxylase